MHSATVKHFSQLRSRHWNLTIKYAPYYIRVSLNCTNSIFPCSRVPSKTAHFIYLSCLLKRPLVCDSLLDFFLGFDGLGNSEECSQAACTISLSFVLSDVFLMTRQGLYGFGRETTEVKCYAHHIIVRAHPYTINMIYHGRCSPNSPAKAVFVSRRACPFSSSPTLFAILDTLIKDIKYHRIQGAPT